MSGRTSGRSMRLWSIALCSFYALLLVPGTFLAYVGLGWVDDAERGWRTQAAAGTLVAAWFPLALGAAFSWQAARSGNGPRLLAATAFVLIALPFYAFTLASGGRMLI